MEDYKEIKTKNGDVIKVDSSDYDYLIKFKWSLIGKGYAYNHKLGMMHRIIMNTPKELQVDHLNKDKLDNRKLNLRNCTNKENSHNTEGSKKSTSKYKGVSWCNTRGKWSSQIVHNGINLFIGRFNTEEEAGRAYDAKVKELFGEYAHLNFK